MVPNHPVGKGEREEQGLLFSLVFEGPELSQGEMLAADLGAALVGVSEVVRTTVSTIEAGSRAEVRVRGVDDGSVIVDLLLWTAGATLLTPGLPDGAKVAFEYIKSFFELLKILPKRGEPKATLDPVKDQGVHIGTVHGDVTFNYGALNTFNNPSTRKGLEGMVQPLRSHKSRSLVVRRGRSQLVSITSEDVEGLAVIPPLGDGEQEEESLRWLSLVKPDVEGKTGWTFREGGVQIPVKVEDEDFLDRVKRGEQLFRSGDAYHVRMRTKYDFRKSGSIRATRRITKVLDVRRSDEQTDLQLGDGSPTA